MEDFQAFYAKRTSSLQFETVKESVCPNYIIHRAYVNQVCIKQEALVIEEAIEEVEEINEEIAHILTEFQLPNQAKVEHR